MNAQPLLVMVASLAVAVLMLLAGIEKNAVEWRKPRRTCPSCGRHLQSGRNCGCTR
jgi:Kef-type K+ transport system membrane component KefB